MSVGNKITQGVNHVAPPATGTALGALTWHSATPAVICAIVCALMRYVLPFALEQIGRTLEHRRSEDRKNAEFARAAHPKQFALYKTKNLRVSEIKVGQQPTATSLSANGPNPQATGLGPHVRVRQPSRRARPGAARPPSGRAGHGR